MPVKTLDEYRRMMEDQYNPLYQSKATNLQSAADNQVSNMNNQKTGINYNYDKQVTDLNRNTSMNQNAYSNNVNSRGLARSSIAVTGLEGIKDRGSRLVNESNIARNNDLGNVDNQINAYRSSIAQQLQALNDEKLSQIMGGANNLYNADVQREYDAQQAEIQRQYQERMQQQQLAAQRAASVASTLQKQQEAAAKAQKEQIVNNAWTRFMQEYNDGTAMDWLRQNPDMVNYVGADVYNNMLSKVTGADNAQNQNLNRYQSSYRASGQGRMLIGE